MKRFFSLRTLVENGSIVVLVLLCVYYSITTWSEQNPVTAGAGRNVVANIGHQGGDERGQIHFVVIVTDSKQHRRFATGVEDGLKSSTLSAYVLHDTVFAAKPADARRGLVALGKAGERIDYIITDHRGSQWRPLSEKNLAELREEYPSLGPMQVRIPKSYMWPSFLTPANLLGIIDQNAAVAIIAIGMTLVIITAGIDLSVGSVMALSGVITAVAIQGAAGGADASVFGIILCCIGGVLVAALCGAFNGAMATFGYIPAFIVTLAMMRIARGLALIFAVEYRSAITEGATAGTPEAISVKAEAFKWLGGETTLLIPNTIWLVVALYIIAHVVMTRTSFGRYVYAVGGNAEAARLSGVPVLAVLITVYALCGASAGLAGIVDASRFSGGRPSAGMLYELQVITAVVVGGTSLFGGVGRIGGTFVGFLIVAVIDNGLNMAGIQSYEQEVVFGVLILAASLLDQLKKHKWKRKK